MGVTNVIWLGAVVFEKDVAVHEKKKNTHYKTLKAVL